ncbi:alpha/beta hydrolase family protein [Erythrobacter oryzae]|uniref:alpha/beta hydrolase family protein n=1 Tax=Erythrobacter oryzae TaxID=3019556 RepID=UPI002552E1D7|nr:alpha/beta fold hydrolase [Erythrobacter sp. COR-2]
MKKSNMVALLGAGAATALAILAAGALHAQETPAGPDEDLARTAQLFGARESIIDISLSPQGTKLAYVTAGPAHTDVLMVIDLAGDAKPHKVIANTETNADIDWCEWATEVRILCQVSGVVDADGVLLPFDRMFAISDDGSNMAMISRRQSDRALRGMQFGGDLLALDVGGDPGKIVMSRFYIPEVTTGTRLANDDSGMGAEIIDVVTGKRSVIERADPDTARYVADELGRVRVKTRTLYDGDGNLTGQTDYYFRTPDSKTWNKFADLTIDDKPAGVFYPTAVESARNMAYGFVRRDGYSAMAEFPLDGTGKGRVLVSRGDVDVDSVIRIGRKRRVVGASYATEKREVAYFDKELAGIARSLGKALPDQPIINFIGASADERQLLLIAASDTQPGMVYLFDKSTSALEPLLPVRGNLEGRKMGSMRSVTYPAADGTQIPAYLTLPPGSDGKGLPAVVLPHGGPAARDEWGFDWIVQFLTARGYAVLQPNYRGSSGYGQAWYGRNGFKAWDVAIGDVNDAGRWLVSSGIAKPDQLAIAGWSYGGYAALQSQVLDPALFKAVVAIAPVTDLGYLVEDASAYTNARLVKAFVGEGDHVASGSPRRFAARFAAPVALFHGTLDLNVAVRHSRGMENALKAAGKQVLYREYPDLQHDLGDSAVRAAMLTEIGQFLDTALGRK